MGAGVQFRKNSISNEAARPLGGMLKRAFDITFSAIALVSLIPAMLLIAVLIRVFDKGPIFFVHERIGFGGQTFRCIKFRTMVTDADKRLEKLLAEDPVARAEWEGTRKLKNDGRIIPVIGRFLRSSSLDELPQFLNVLIGDMSVVGPRPVTFEEYQRYNTARRYYASVRPGITGLWQVSGRNDITFEGRVRIDRRYVRTWSMLQDLGIIFKTVEVVARRKGAY